MTTKKMTGRERLLTTMRHEEPDRVPICPRYGFWLEAEYGANVSLDEVFKILPDVDFMYMGGNENTPNYLESFPDEYALPGVTVEQKKYQEQEFGVVERVFHTPAGTLSDRTKIPPAGREFGVAPNPIRTEHVVKCRADLEPLKYILPEINANHARLRDLKKEIGNRGIAGLTVRCALDHHAGYARDMQDLMTDYFDDREFFDELIRIFHRRSLSEIKAGLEYGLDFIFGSWYFTSLSAGWSPAIFKEVFVPLIREHVALTHQYGAYYDYYDDGKLNGTMEMIAGTGVDVLETCTPPPVGDFNLALAKAKIGKKTTLKGYVDLIYVMKYGTPALVEKTVREAMEIAKPGGGWIIGSSDSFRDGTPCANIEAYFKACKEYGKY
ncbi:MAG: hypothetical protein NT011_05570 [Kiritimatiellaeota bacterium]|nr:hypothetical protein [Kiritimatiellota bacterium]